MKIAIIGAGNIGGTLTRRFREIGHDVFVANSRGPETLSELAEKTGATTVSGTSGRVALPVAGDDANAKTFVTRLVEELGFNAVDAGTLDESWKQQPGTPVYGQDRPAEFSA